MFDREWILDSLYRRESPSDYLRQKGNIMILFLQ